MNGLVLLVKKGANEYLLIPIEDMRGKKLTELDILTVLELPRESIAKLKDPEVKKIVNNLVITIKYIYEPKEEDKKEEKKDALSIKFDKEFCKEYGLPQRICNVLGKDTKTIGDLMAKTEKEIKKRGLREESLQKIRGVLHKFGLKLQK